MKPRVSRHQRESFVAPLGDEEPVERITVDASIESGGELRFSVLEPGEVEPGSPPA
jgi:hypothetical protein